MPDHTPADIRAALAAFKARNAKGYEDLEVYAACIADELGRLKVEEPRLAPADLEEMFTEPPDYECADTMGVIHYMLGYLRGAADALAIPPWDIVRAITAS